MLLLLIIKTLNWKLYTDFMMMCDRVASVYNKHCILAALLLTLSHLLVWQSARARTPVQRKYKYRRVIIFRKRVYGVHMTNLRLRTFQKSKIAVYAASKFYLHTRCDGTARICIRSREQTSLAKKFDFSHIGINCDAALIFLRLFYTFNIIYIQAAVFTTFGNNNKQYLVLIKSTKILASFVRAPKVSTVHDFFFRREE